MLMFVECHDLHKYPISAKKNNNITKSTTLTSNPRNKKILPFHAYNLKRPLQHTFFFESIKKTTISH